MEGYKEILFSFTVGLIAIGTFHLTFKPNVTSQDRLILTQEPTVFHGRAEESNLSLSWGLKAIHAREAWKVNRGSKDIVVAVIDTGCDVHHPDLSRNIWTNLGETGIDENGLDRASNGLDDDGNGFTDDVHGWNFVADNADVTDEHGHGTHIAGVIGAGSSGIAPNVSLMILKYFDDNTSGEDNLRFTINAIHYAIQMGAQVINYSGGGVLRSDEEREALREASEKGIVVVAAAGNEGLNSDFFHFYPADYDLPNIVSVGATDRHGKLLSISNYGKKTVDIAAPGKNIYSTLPGGEHGFMSGTSQATAFTSGLIALMLSEDSELDSPIKIIDQLVQSSQELPSLKGRSRSEGIINAKKTLDSLRIPVALDVERSLAEE